MANINEADQRQMLDIAREVISDAVMDDDDFSHENIAPVSFSDHSGIFVTIHVKGELRGCIGSLDPDLPPVEALIYAAKAASTRDYRFNPIRPDELPDLTFDITVLEPRERISSPGQIVIGEHGLYFQLGGGKGILLPQVAGERDWTPIQFLEAVCRKAGLPSDSWRDPHAEIYRFRATLIESATAHQP
jgi:AmmeMemoRadiSam system protein A